MKKNNKEQADELADIAESAHALLEATANLTGQKVKIARKDLTVALKHAKTNGKDLVDETTEIANDSLQELRDRVSAALDQGKEIYDDVHDGLVSQTKAADHTVHEHPYTVMGVALGLGALVGFLVSSRFSRNGH